MSKTGKKYNFEDINLICKKINFELLESKDSFNSKYKNTFSKIQVKCQNCDKISEIQINNLINKFRYNKYPCSCYYKHTRESFLKKAKEIHGDKYDYSLITEEWWKKNYKKVDNTKIPIICPKHGIFYQKIGEHFYLRNNCPWCTSKLHYIDFMEKAKEIHQNKYEYLFDEKWWLENFTSQETTKVKIKCPDHGVFEQVVSNHLRQGAGCPKCKESKGERKIRQYLEENKIKYSNQKPIKIEGRNRSFYFDFYLPDYNLAIEFDGIYHFENDDERIQDRVVKTMERDKLKNQYCEENNIDLLRIPYWEFKDIDSILEKKLKNQKERL